VLVDCFDDEGDPDRNRTLVDQLTDDGRIFAVVPATSVALFADDLLNARHIPYIGVGDLPAYCGFDASFGFGQTGALGCPALAAATTPVVAVPHIELAAMAAGVDAAGLKVALVRSDSIAGELLASSVALEAEVLGAELVLDAPDVPAPAEAARAGWSTVAESVNDADADLVIIDGGRTQGLYAALRDDFDGVVVGTAYADPAALADDPDLLAALAGSFQISQGFDTTAEGPGAEQFRFDATAIGLAAEPIDRAVLSGYMAADLLVAAIAITPAPITSEALHNIVNNGWQYPGIDGLLCPGWWPASHVVPYACAAVAQVVPLGAPLVNVVPLRSFPLLVRTPAEASTED
jgi:ABC-type branched-subunit amino acid transport system substrate-binding protein